MKTAQITGSKAAERGWPKKRSCVRLSGGSFISVNSRARPLVPDEAPSSWEKQTVRSAPVCRCRQQLYGPAAEPISRKNVQGLMSSAHVSICNRARDKCTHSCAVAETQSARSVPGGRNSNCGFSPIPFGRARQCVSRVMIDFTNGFSGILPMGALTAMDPKADLLCTL